MTRPRTIGLLVEERYLAQSQPAGMLAALRARGHTVAVVDPRSRAYLMGDDSWLDGLDLVVARGRSWDLLCLLAWAEARGVPAINRRAAIGAVHNKAEMAVALASAGLPAPQTWFGGVEQLAGMVPEASYPLILKLLFGDNCRGLAVAASADELSRIGWPEAVAVAQTYHATDGYDVKLYGIGADVWAVRKPSPFNARDASASDASGLVEMTPDLEAIGRRCGEIFGLDLFGVDCILTGDGPLVIEVNDYPNYTSVPGADDRLAEFVLSRCGGGGGVR